MNISPIIKAGCLSRISYQHNNLYKIKQFKERYKKSKYISKRIFTDTIVRSTSTLRIWGKN